MQEAHIRNVESFEVRFDLLQWLLHSVMAPCMYALVGVGLYVCHTVCIIKCEWLSCAKKTGLQPMS